MINGRAKRRVRDNRGQRFPPRSDSPGEFFFLGLRVLLHFFYLMFFFCLYFYLFTQFDSMFGACFLDEISQSRRKGGGGGERGRELKKK